MESNGAVIPSPFENSLENVYHFIKIIGRGTFGEAVLYKRVKDNTLTVWKEISLGLCSEDGKENVETQLEKLTWMQHANVVSCRNFFMEDQCLYMEVEYANGGTLHEKIGIQDNLFGEEMVIWYFFQVLSSLEYIHRQKILHRDVKCANIFLTKSGLVKLGDFGILHVSVEEYCNQDDFEAPYNSSPEFLAGKQFSASCDLWAIGCVLYELLTLRSVYEGMIEGTVDENILKKNVTSISPIYSSEMTSLLAELLSTVPEKRPSASQILTSPIFSTLGKAMASKVEELNKASQRSYRISAPANIGTVPPAATIADAKEVLCWGGGKDTPSVLAEFHGADSAVQVHAGNSHVAAVTMEKELFTWMTETSDDKTTAGQLGHGDKEKVSQPKKVEALQGIPIKMASCGKEFTACLTDSGTLYTFGSDYSGCLGCNQEEGEEVDSPLEVTFFHGKPVQQVSCGERHILALTQEREVFSWGCGEKGCLGLGSEKSMCVPTKVPIPTGKTITELTAGIDGSLFLTTDKDVLVCGSNKDNKLGLNLSTNGLRKNNSQTVFEVAFKTLVSLVRPLARYAICSVSSGKSHSAAITDGGLVLTFGQNKYGQLGMGDFKPRLGICEVKGPLAFKQVEKVACGDGFTVVATKDFQVYSFGCASRGRLGVSTDLSSSHRKRSAIPTPQPIFATPCQVSALSCRSSHTIAIMQKVMIASQETDKQASLRKLSVTSQSSTDDDLYSVSSGPSARSSFSNSLDYQRPSEHYLLKVNRQPMVTIDVQGNQRRSSTFQPASTKEVAPSLPLLPTQTSGMGQSRDVATVISPPDPYRDVISAKFVPISSEDQHEQHPFPVAAPESVKQRSIQLHSVQSNSGADVALDQAALLQGSSVQSPNSTPSTQGEEVPREVNISQTSHGALPATGVVVSWMQQPSSGHSVGHGGIVSGMQQPFDHSVTHGAAGHGRYSMSPNYIPPSGRMKYPNHSRPPEEGQLGSRKGALMSRRDRLREEEVEMVLERNRELEFENFKLRKLVWDLERKNEDLNRQVSAMHVVDEPPADFV